jgi:hypothetical protein
MRFPEIRVTRAGVAVKRVEWDPCRDGAALFDITGMRVTQVESVIKPDGSIPAVKVTFAARLVEVDDGPEAPTSLGRSAQ